MVKFGYTELNKIYIFKLILPRYLFSVEGIGIVTGKFLNFKWK